jgi:carboxymethylenebutenolidase
MPSETIDIRTADGVCDAYLARPDMSGRFPAVLFFMDGIGVRPVLHRMADRIAANGFLVLLPNLFYRAGRAPVFDVATILQPENRPKLMELVNALTPDRIGSDAGTFLEFLAARPEVTPGSKVGLTGYCMGGAMVMRTAARFPDRIAAGASFHGGRLATTAADSPHLLAGAIKAELYFGHADQDQGMPIEDIKRLEDALSAAGTRYESELYAGALHGYTMPDLPVYNETACDKHWGRMLGLFAKTLKAASAG